MAQPFDYSIQPADYTTPLMTGFDVGQKLAALQQARQQQMQFQQDASQVAQNPTTQGITNLTVKYPQYKDAFKQAYDQMNQQQQQDSISFASRLYAASQAGNIDLQKQMIQQRIDAAKNSGQDSEAYESMLQGINQDPNFGKYISGMYLSSTMGADKFANTFKSLGEEKRATENQPLEAQKTAAETAYKQAQTQGVFGDLELKKQANQIEMMKVQLSKETNALEREKLANQIAVQQRDFGQKYQERQAEASNSLSALDNTLDTVRQLKLHPGLASNLGVRGVIPNIPGSDAANAAALIEQLQSQSFLSQVEKMRGLGALTEAEGAKLNNALGALKTSQSEDQFRKQLNSIETLISKARNVAVQKYGANGSDAATGGVVWANHPKFGLVTQNRLNSLASQAGMSPDEFVQFARTLK